MASASANVRAPKKRKRLRDALKRAPDAAEMTQDQPEKTPTSRGSFLARRLIRGVTNPAARPMPEQDQEDDDEKE